MNLYQNQNQNQNMSQQSEFQLSSQQFHERFKIIGTFSDPFLREYILTNDKINNLQAVYKHYLSQNQEQQNAILDNLENYQKLSEHEGICKLLAFTILVEQKQILAAFQYNQFTIQQYVKTEHFQKNKNKFYVIFFAEMIEIIKMMMEIGIDLDEINYTNILIFHDETSKDLKIKVLYDQREKIYDKVISGIKTFSSPQKIYALLTNDQNYFMGDDITAPQNIYQLGLILIDMMYECETESFQFQNQSKSRNNPDDFISRDRPVSRSRITQYEKSYYIFQNGQVRMDQIYLKEKIQYLRSSSSHFIKQLVEMAVRMIQNSSLRINLDQLIGEAERVSKIFKDSQRKIPRSSSIQKQVYLNQNNQHQNLFNNSHNMLSSFSYPKQQVNTNLSTFNPNNQQFCQLAHNKIQEQKIITSSKNLKSEDVKDVYESIHEYQSNKIGIPDSRTHLSRHSNPAQSQSETKNGLENTKQTYYNNLTSTAPANTVNDIGYKTKYPSNQFPITSNNFSQPETELQINGFMRVTIPRQHILMGLKCHQSIRGALQNLIDELESLKNLIKKQYYDCSIYYGETHSQTNKRSGLGIYIYPQGDVYYGSWHENQLINGTYVFKNGQSYQGQVKNGKQGWGRYRYINGNVYEGEWKNDIKDGKGTMWYPNQDKYDGNWHKGKKNGFGKYFYNNGTLYEGNFSNGRKNGFGIITFTNGTRIEANWSLTHIQGQGKVFYPNGDFFQGQYHYSQKHGKGLYVWGGNDEAKYEGQFKKDTLQGQARIHFTDKQYYFGRIKNGKRDGQGDYQYQNGDRFIGEWKNDLKLIGNYKFVHGDQFQGKFKDNQLNFGVLKYANGQSYEGEFKNGYRNGVGSYKNKLGILAYEGHWEMDIFMNKNQ